MMLIYFLIIVFTILVLHKIFLAFFISDNLVEGLENQTTTQTSSEYQPYNVNDPNSALILSQQNAGNIEVLKGRVDGLDGVKQKVDDMQQSINSMQVQIDDLVQQQADYAQELAGAEPVEVTGTEEETVEDVEDDIENS
jgi:hypothetical protein